MISIIISSYKPDYFKQVENNISETIGITYEIIKIYNPGIFSLSQAYNKGAHLAKFDFLCFLHEDVLFHSSNWGLNIINHFNNVSNLGLIGIVGSVSKSSKPTSWNSQVIADNKGFCLMPDSKTGTTKRIIRVVANLELVKVLDGVFLATTKCVWKDNMFDENIHGYHMYDLDFSLRIATKYKVAVANDILLEHFSLGVFDETWVKASINYHMQKEKINLFDKDNKKINTQFYLGLLTGYNIRFKTKIAYLKILGFNYKDLPAVIYFLISERTRNIYRYARRG